MPLEPVCGEFGDLLERSRPLEEVSGPSTTANSLVQVSSSNPSRLSSSTCVSAPPTTNSVAADTADNCSDARSTRPPRDTTAPTSSPWQAAARSAAAAPVLEPK